MIAAMKDIQSTYGGKNITEAQLEEQHPVDSGAA